MVTVFRATARSGRAAASGDPQASQTLIPASHSAPHAGQRGTSGFPHSPQNLAPGRVVLPQLGQVMAVGGAGSRSSWPSWHTFIARTFASPAVDGDGCGCAGGILRAYASAAAGVRP